MLVFFFNHKSYGTIHGLRFSKAPTPSLMRFGSNEGFLYRVFKTHVARGMLKLRVLCKRLCALLLVPKFTQYQPENVVVIRCLWVDLDCVPCGVSRFL